TRPLRRASSRLLYAAWCHACSPGSRPPPCPETAEVRQFDRRVPPWVLMIRRAGPRRIPVAAATLEMQLAGEIAQGGQVVAGREVVDQRHRRRHAARQGLVRGVTQ